MFLLCLLIERDQPVHDALSVNILYWELISTFLINATLEIDKWAVESILLIEFYLEPSLVLLESALGEIGSGFSKILGFSGSISSFVYNERVLGKH